MLEQIAASAAKGALDLQVSAANQRLQSKHYKENQDYLAAVQRRNAAQTYQTAVRSLNEAGLNPAIAAGANTMQTAVAPSTSGSPSVGEMNPEQSMVGSRKSLMRKEEELHDNQMEVGNSTIALNDANSSKAYSDAMLADEQRRGEKLKNDKLAETNGIVNEQFGAFLNYLIKGASAVGDKKRVEVLNNLLMMWDSTKHHGATYGSGALEAINAINSAMLADSDKYTKMMDNVVRNSVNQATLNDKKVLDALVKAPLDKRRSIYSQIAETNKHIALMDEQMKNLGASTALTEEQQKNIEAQTRKIEQEIIKIGREAASIYYNDPHQMYNEGDYFHLGTYLLGEQIKFQQDIIKSAAGAATFGALTRGAGGAARAVPAAAPAAPASGIPSRIPPQAPRPSNAPPVPLAEQNAAFGRKLEEVKHRKGSASIPTPAPRGVRKSSNEHLQGEVVFMNGKPYFWENGNWRELKSWK